MSAGIYLFFVGVLIPLCFAASQTILYNGLAVTLIPGSSNPTIGLAPLHINDTNQQWILPTGPNGVISSGNPSYANIVWDVNAGSKAEGTKVILYMKKDGNNPNQQWTVSNGVITSSIAANFTVAPNGTSNLRMTYAPPAQATFIVPITQPWHCSSIGDPHIIPYITTGSRNDLYSPGSQQPGTYTLSKTGVAGDPDYFIIQADQQLCRPNVQGVYCNKRVILKTLGHLIEVNGDTVTIDSVVTPINGTLQVGNGLNVTKVGTKNYVVSYPNGQVQYQTISYYGEIYITVTHGPLPTGGVCTPILGPNYNNTSGGKVSPYNFLLSWRAPNISDDLFKYSDYTTWRAANPINFTSSEGNCTTMNGTLYAAALSICAPLAVNSPLARQCAALVPTAPINFAYQACLDDIICTGDYSFGPSSIDAYSKICSANVGPGITIVLPTSGANSIALGPGLASSIGLSFNPISFNITARDVNGVIVTTGGDNFVVTSTGGFLFSITYIGRGIYQVTYIPSVIGTFTISITLNGIADILNGPFTIIIAVQGITQPLRCSSVGDPHIIPYTLPGARNDLYSPGSQQPGTYTLSKTGKAGDPDFLIVQADQQQCRPNVQGVYCNKRVILKTLGFLVEVNNDTVTINGIVTPIYGTLQIGVGVNVTKIGAQNYVVAYPNGKVQYQTLYYYSQIYVTATQGPIPSGGVCTPILGPNYNNTSGGQVSAYNFVLSWRAPNISDDLFSYSNYSTWRAANPFNFTSSDGNCATVNETLLTAARSICASLTINYSLAVQCAALVPTAPINFVYQACLDDIICTGDYSFGPSSIDAFFKICSANAGPGITISLPTSGANSVASGPGLASSISLSANPISFNITARDVNGVIVTTGRDNFVVTSTGGFSFSIIYLGGGIYQVTYTPWFVGTFTISITLNGIADILNGPFTVTIYIPTITQPLRCSSVGDPHITPYTLPGARNDLYSPGSQQPGTYTLSKTGIAGDPNYLIIQADQQQCQPNVQGVYCNRRVVLKTLGHLVEVNGDMVTIDGIVTSITGTLQVGSSLNVTKVGTKNYVVSYPNGQVQYQTISYYSQIYVTATQGLIPTGGVCTPFLGPNYNNPFGGQVSPYNFLISWRAPNISYDLFNYTDYLTWRAANPINFTSSDGYCATANATLFNAARFVCASLTINSPLAVQCAVLVPTAPISFVYQACLDDVICTGDYSFGPSLIDAYSKICSANAGPGINIVLPTSGANSVASGPGIAGNIGLSTNRISFNITARDVNGVVVTTGGDNFVVTSTGGFSFSITYIGGGVYQVTYTPSVVGIYTISISLNGIVDILNSPFTVIIEAQITVPALSTAFGPGLNATVAKSSILALNKVSFTIVARTALGVQRTSGGDNVNFVLSAGFYPMPYITDNNDGTYTAAYYTSYFPGQFIVAVTINAQQILGSPFPVYVV